MTNLSFVENQLGFFDEFCELHSRVKGLHNSISELQPVAIVKDNKYFLFVPQNGKYEFITEHPTPFSIDFEIYAAFPLDFYQNEIAAIVTENALRNEKNHVVVLHEFVHCFQWNTCEQNIRSSLTIEQEQMSMGAYDWEINYSFPYEDDLFVSMTEKLCRTNKFADYHKKLHKHLKKTDFEYLIWQEWKEGFARYIENLIRANLGVELDYIALSRPFDRVSLYEIGSRHIASLIKEDNSLSNDLQKLFCAMV